MEAFNKNWLAILLIAVVFGTLGFLVGRTTRHHHGRHGDKERKRFMFRNDAAADTFDIKVDVETIGDDKTISKTDTIVKDGKTIIVREVKKVKE